MLLKMVTSVQYCCLVTCVIADIARNTSVLVKSEILSYFK